MKSYTWKRVLALCVTLVLLGVLFAGCSGDPTASGVTSDTTTTVGGGDVTTTTQGNGDGNTTTSDNGGGNTTTANGPTSSTQQGSTAGPTAGTTTTTKPNGGVLTGGEYTMANGDFEASALIMRAANGKIVNTGIVFFEDEGATTYYGAYLRCDTTNNRVDFFVSKFVDNSWMGFMIAEEYASSGKDCFVSVDEGWDATSDQTFTLSVKVTGYDAVVRMTGNNSKKYGELTFNLAAGASGEVGNFEYWNTGYVHTTQSTGTAANLTVKVTGNNGGQGNTSTTTTQPQQSASGVALANIFGDGMVLQRGKQVKVWGTASGVSSVTVSFKGQTKTAAVSNGKWSVYLSAMNADANGATLTVKGGNYTASISDVLVGDVWLCSGQSNMEWIVGSCSTAQREQIKQLLGSGSTPSTNNIRLTKVPLASSRTELEDLPVRQEWTNCSYNEILSNSAYAAVFAGRLEQVLDVPIGILNSSFGGTDIQQWLSIETTDKLNVTYNYHRKYNAMIAPITGFTCKGILWYQGCNNVKIPTQYATYFEAYAAQCRADFEDASLPIVTTMLANFYDVNNLEWGMFRVTQWEIAQKVANVEIVAQNDLGDKNNIHPNCKYEIGVRAAELTLNRIYGLTSYAGESAYAKSATKSGNTVTVTLGNAESGIKLTSGSSVNNLVVVDAAGTEHTVNGTLSGGKLVIDVTGITNPKTVKYCCIMWPENVNFYTNNGLPVVPFSVAIG